MLYEGNETAIRLYFCFCFVLLFLFTNVSYWCVSEMDSDNNHLFAMLPFFVDHLFLLICVIVYCMVTVMK